MCLLNLFGCCLEINHHVILPSKWKTKFELRLNGVVLLFFESELYFDPPTGSVVASLNITTLDTEMATV
ncbi:hypothetical protein RO3G_17079 [Rhizopus delemar RA 99-880]|uniref:Uncharacterized protein n=1 Tax=Rhizopus delemar (strain RA 99-880 / ATCC MYA-4621 / FGSC 9543 / NRRL 43880) TaxID=246409 RepID=I1CUZ2_RHIO9|nr:hypothetical protein RO3G_17079 [Rhizopus delemar RA 99-880]|eukprot:EIE92272.1 hypothetical protein RO3G_17079 [Rhizopus delemar RA 99-880]